MLTYYVGRQLGCMSYYAWHNKNFKKTKKQNQLDRKWREKNTSYQGLEKSKQGKQVIHNITANEQNGTHNSQNNTKNSRKLA